MILLSPDNVEQNHNTPNHGSAVPADQNEVASTRSHRGEVRPFTAERSHSIHLKKPADCVAEWPECEKEKVCKVTSTTREKVGSES